jgi:transglycosylase-like protein with SLT domain
MLVMIAAVAAWPILARSAAAPRSSTTEPARIAARVQALIAINSQNAQIVTFADPRLAPVRIVRGGGEAMSLPEAHRVSRGGTVVAAPRAFPVMRRADPGSSETVSFADPLERPVTVLRGLPPTPAESDRSATAANAAFELFAPASGAALDRVAFAVDGAESSHGADAAMWRPEFDGPQGPMQVSAAAAVDAGGGDRFDPTQNRLLGRAYLAWLYGRYGNWPDAVAAYNWGPGNLDGWIAAGRPSAGLPLEVERYRDRVLRDGGLPQTPDAGWPRTAWQLRTP